MQKGEPGPGGDAGISFEDTLGSDAPAGSAGDEVGFVPVDPHHYHRGAEIARGGMGRIIAARDRRLGRKVAIKELLGAGAEVRSRFEREARLTARLQHPAIVNLIEAGTWPDGEPFFAMKLVAGRSLDQVIAERKTLAERLALLPNVIAAVDALAYAHAERIIHRDLKPGNVLIGDYGETVVIDWGLAKDLADAAATEEPAGPYRTAASPTQTIEGSVMGTPAYMPPEQALGEAVDERADVYALGAMLHHVLSGKPPFGGKTLDELLVRVIEGKPEPLEAVTGIPLDLITVVRKAMSPDKADRYPTARELAEELKRFQTGQLVGAHRYSSWQLVRRWMRRHRAVLSVAALLVTVLAVVSVISLRRIVEERDEAERQRSLAEQRGREASEARTVADTRRRAAEQLVDFSVTTLSERLRTVGRLDILSGVGDAILAYYQQVGDLDSDDDVDAIARRATALDILGDVERMKGHFDSARVHYDRALALRRQVLAQAPEPVHRHGLALALSSLGQLEREVARFPESLLVLEEARTQMDAAIAADRASERWHVGLATVYAQIGDTHRYAQQFEPARDAYGKAGAIWDRLAGEHPDDPQWQSRQLEIAGSIGDTYFYAWDFPPALEAYRKNLALAERYHAGSPKDLSRRALLGSAWQRVAYTELWAEDSLAARRDAERSIAIYEGLVASEPDNAIWEGQLAMLHGIVAEASGKLGELEVAVRHARTALDIRVATQQRSLDNVEYLRETALAHGTLGNLELQRGQAAVAVREQELGLEVMQQVIVLDPNNAGYARDRAVALAQIGDARLALGDRTGAIAAYVEVAAFFRPLRQANPGDEQSLLDLAEVTSKLGDMQLAARDPAAAATLREALTLIEALLALHPDDVVSKLDVANACADLAAAVPATEARPLLERAIATRQVLLDAGTLPAEERKTLSEHRRRLAALDRQK